MLFFTSPKEIYSETPKTFKSLGGHGSTHNQMFFGGFLKISSKGHLRIQDPPPLDPIMKALASM